ncbi:MAG: hypothetical protein IAG13_12860 [Deltaproteobacteria bacterium]|nr:hypothetical protein [Nannocystaceae bacterium]
MSSIVAHPTDAALASCPSEIIRLEPAFYPALALDVPVAPGLVRAHGHQLACVLGLPAPVGLFENPAGPASGLVAVSASRPPFEVGIADWCRFRCLHAQWSLASSGFVDTPHGRRFEIVASRETLLGPLRRRDVAFFDGGWLVQIHALAKPDAWSDSGAMWSRMADETALVRGPGTGGCEARTTVPVSGTSISFDVPASWTVSTVARPGTADVELVADCACVAWIHLRARAATPPWSLEQRRAQLCDRLTRRGLRVGEDVQTDVPGNDASLDALGFEDGWVLDAITPSGAPRDVRAWLRRVGDVHVDAMLVAPPPGTRHLPWMRAIRAFELAFATASSGDVDRG